MSITHPASREEAAAAAIAFAPAYRDGTNGEFWISKARAALEAADAYDEAHGFPFADRRVKTGAKDTGDIGGVHVHDQPVAIEVKNYGGRLEPSTWLKEAQVEAVNADAAIGVVVAKRRGTTEPGHQYVLLELRDLVFLMTGKFPRD
jgi:hypothetical protein